MTDHVTPEQVHLFRQGRLEEDDLEAILDHLPACPVCRKQIAPPGEALTVAHRFLQRLDEVTLAPAEHLSFEQLQAWATGQLSGLDEGAIASHLETCGQCGEDLEEIRAYQRVVAGLSQEPPHHRRALLSRPLWGSLAAVGAIATIVLAVQVIRHTADNGSSTQQAAVPTKLPSTTPSLSPSVETDQALSRLPPDDARAVRETLRTFKLEVPESVSPLTGRTGVLLGPAATAGTRLIDPVATLVVSAAPTFEWEPLSGAEFQVTVFDANYREVQRSPWIAGTRWSSPRELARNTTYSWQITIKQGNNILRVPTPPAPEARFRVLGSQDAARVRAWRDQPSQSPIVLGILLVRAGLLADAEASFSDAVARYPDSEIPPRLLADLRQARTGRSSR